MQNSKIEIIKKGSDYKDYYHKKNKDGTLFTGIDTIFFYCNYDKWLCEEDTFYCNKDTCISLLFYKTGNLTNDIAYFTNGNKRHYKKYNGYKYADTVYFWDMDGKIESIIYPPANKQVYTYSDIPWYVINPMVSWYKNGQKKYDIVFFKSHGISTKWYPNGQLKEQNELSLDGTISGYSKQWCENGKMKHDYLIGRGKQLYIVNNCGGKKIGEGNFVNALWNKVGRWRYWYENDQLMLEEFYKDTEDPKMTNYRIGTWSWWDEKGNLTKQEIYENDTLKETKNFMPPQKNKNQ